MNTNEINYTQAQNIIIELRINNKLSSETFTTIMDVLRKLATYEYNDGYSTAIKETNINN
jgi:hypothetical protein